MPTPGERRALIFFAALGALGVGVRGWQEFRPANRQAFQPTAGDRAGLAHQIEAVDSAIASGAIKRTPRTARPDSALSRHGGGKRSRETTGPGARSAGAPPAAGSAGALRDAARSVARRPRGGAPKPSRRIVGRRQQGYAQAGSAGAAPAHRPRYRDVADREVAAVAQIGPGLARRIVRDRIENGPFGSIDGLQRISGISPGLARRLQPYVTFSLAPRPDSAGKAGIERSTVRRGRRRSAP